MRLTVATRIAGGFMAVLLLAAGIVIVGLVGLSKVNSNLLAVTDGAAPMIDASARMQAATLEARAAVMLHYQSSTPSELTAIEAEFQTAKAQYDSASQALNKLAESDPNILQAFNSGHSASAQIFDMGPKVLQAHRDDVEKGLLVTKQKRELGDMGDELSALLAETKNPKAQEWDKTAVEVSKSVIAALDKVNPFAVNAAAKEIGAKFAVADEFAAAAPEADKAIAASARLKAAAIGEKGLLGLYVAQLQLRKNASQMLQDMGKASKSANNQLVVLNKAVSELTLNAKETADDSVSWSQRLLMGFGVVALLVSVAVAYWISHAISGQLKQLSGAMSQIERDLDFTQRVQVIGNDEVAATAVSFNHLVATVQAALRDTREASTNIAEVARSLLQAANQVSDGSIKQSAASGTMASAIEELSTSISQVSDSASSAHELTHNAGNSARAGADIITNTVHEMTAISSEISQLGMSVDELGKRSKEISSIVQVIKEVAAQTNLLALNAAIEAARAGEQGRGFAVVADEVRLLAERTTGATKDIVEKINAIQDSVETAVKAVRSTVGQMDSGVVLVKKAGDAMSTITEGATEVEKTVYTISDALVEQNSTGHLIAANVEQIAQMVDQNTRAANDASSLARNLESVVQKLEASISRFRN
ncbi:HAMP domain-containing methyl-accepting chemotaxis protein [Chitinimonas sp. PSY-7]|uniref:methyl-accepting chemotaxis protein n=1 Tax=Chitinimonas sp. PSY-7 TaxID=3459088 RepID=UPI00403FED1D